MAGPLMRILCCQEMRRGLWFRSIHVKTVANVQTGVVWRHDRVTIPPDLHALMTDIEWLEKHLERPGGDLGTDMLNSSTPAVQSRVVPSVRTSEVADRGVHVAF